MTTGATLHGATGANCDFGGDGGDHKAKYTVTQDGKESHTCAKHLPNAYAAVGNKAPWTHKRRTVTLPEPHEDIQP